MDDIRGLRKSLKDILHTIERLAGKNAPPEATQEMVHRFWRSIVFAAKLRDLYATRLTYGLHQFLARYRRAIDWQAGVAERRKKLPGSDKNQTNL